MVSRVFCTLEVDGQRQESHVDVKQTVGGDYETTPLEVGRPHGYRGPLDYDRSRAEVEKYHRSLVGSGASRVLIQDGSDIRMRNNTFQTEYTFTIQAEATGGAW
jgi:hypothetical protein